MTRSHDIICLSCRSRLHKHTQKVQRRLNSEDDISEPLSAVSDGSSVNEQRMADPSTVDELTSEESKEVGEGQGRGRKIKMLCFQICSVS